MKYIIQRKTGKADNDDFSLLLLILLIIWVLELFLSISNSSINFAPDSAYNKYNIHG